MKSIGRIHESDRFKSSCSGGFKAKWGELGCKGADSPLLSASMTNNYYVVQGSMLGVGNWIVIDQHLHITRQLLQIRLFVDTQ
uniref:Uncharacterized protein n=1 Tax=Daphnia galeata TaxID=27404 RepID=A0A8J2WFS0_9CRUS|nr:unnamed protein product [Daphnia galeata]